MRVEIEHLRLENEQLSRSSRIDSPVTSMLTMTDRSTPFPSRRQPTGLSDEADEIMSETETTSCTELRQLEEERAMIERQIRHKQEEQRILHDRLQELRGISVTNSKTCVVQ